MTFFIMAITTVASGAMILVLAVPLSSLLMKLQWHALLLYHLVNQAPLDVRITLVNQLFFSRMLVVVNAVDSATTSIDLSPSFVSRVLAVSLCELACLSGFYADFFCL